LVEKELRQPALGEIVVKVEYFSCDPTQRIWATDAPQYMPPVKVGEIMRSLGSGIIVASNNANYKEGDYITGIVGWNEYFIGVPNVSFLSVVDKKIPIGVLMGPCGMTGLTAYYGLFEIGKPKAGDRVLVSGAAGSTGSMVCQLAKISGCHVTAIAGGPEKCKWLKEVIGVDEAIDYKSESIYKRVKEIANVDPVSLTGGYDVFYDNVGGESLEAALVNLAFGGRVIICGAIQQYNASEPYALKAYTMLLMRRGTMQGFLVSDYANKNAVVVPKIAKFVMEGRIKYQTDIQTGPIETVVNSLNRVFTSQNNGKQLHKL